MSVGIFINGQRPASKKAVKEAIAANPASVHLENTSGFSNNFDIDLDEKIAQGDFRTAFVGPDPYNKRNFYGTIEVKDGRVKVS